jgi:hypothetical protein
MCACVREEEIKRDSRSCVLLEEAGQISAPAAAGRISAVAMILMRREEKRRNRKTVADFSTTRRCGAASEHACVCILRPAETKPE